MTKKWRDIMDELSNYKETVTLLRVGSDGERVELTFNSEALTWQEMIERYINFLYAIGYVITEEDRDRLLDY